MHDDQSRWNQKYSQQNFPTEPSWVVEKYHVLAKQGKALDVGAGAGRNALYLAEKGFEVDAVDLSEVGLDNIKKQNSLIRTHHKDLEKEDLPQGSFDLIVNLNFLLRRLFPQIKERLKPGGILIFQTFIDSPHLADGKTPYRKEFYLKSNELLLAFKGFQILFYEEKGVLDPIPDQKNQATLVAVKPS